MYKIVDRVVMEGFHKFVYYDHESILSLRNLENEYIPKINSSESIVIYIKDLGLPKMNTVLELDNYRINFFYERYVEIVIVLSIIDRLINYIEVSELNKRFESIFGLFSRISKRKIQDIDTLRTMLIESKNMYSDGYIEYMKTGKIDFYDKVSIPFIIIDNLLADIKMELGLERHFALILEFCDDVDKYTCRAINDYVASRCTGYLSMNILLHNESEWKCFYANNGQFIQNVHDYTEIDLTKHKIRSKNI